MTKEHKIRSLVGHLRGKERDDAILTLMTHPERISIETLRANCRLRRNTSRTPGYRHLKTPKQFAVTLNVTYDQYKDLNRSAKKAKKTLPDYILGKL